MNMITKSLAIELTDTFDGKNWYWSNFVDSINGVNCKEATIKVAGFPNSIAEIVWHMTQWKIFCIRKLEKDVLFDIGVNSENDWRRFPSLREDEWDALKDSCKEATSKLASQIACFEEEMLFDKVPGKPYQFFRLIVGVIEHEVLHASQINYLRRFIKSHGT